MGEDDRARRDKDLPDLNQTSAAVRAPSGAGSSSDVNSYPDSPTLIDVDVYKRQGKSFQNEW